MEQKRRTRTWCGFLLLLVLLAVFSLCGIALETCAARHTQNAAPSDEFGGGGAQNGSLPKSRISSDRGKGVREGRLPPSSAFACEIAYHTSSR